MSTAGGRMRRVFGARRALALDVVDEVRLDPEAVVRDRGVHRRELDGGDRDALADRHVADRRARPVRAAGAPGSRPGSRCRSPRRSRSAWIHSLSRFSPSFVSAIVTAPTFDERWRICATVIRSVGLISASWTTRSATWIEYGSVNVVCGVTRCSASAPPIVTTLKTEPGSYTSEMAWFVSSAVLTLREVVRVVARLGRHREHRTGVRVDDDRGRVLRVQLGHRRAQHLLGVRLDAVVDREEHVLAGLRRDVALDVDRAAERVADDRLLAGNAGELRVELELEAGEAVVVDAREPEHLRRDRALRIRAPLLPVEVEAGEVALREQARLVRRRLALDVDEVRSGGRELHGARLRASARGCARRRSPPCAGA